MINKIWEKKWCFFAGVICFIFHSLRLFMTYDIKILNDEIGTLASAAYLAGYDWSNVVGVTKYYGFGYYFIDAIWFSLFDDPIQIYFAIRITNIVALSIGVMVYYRIAIKHLEMKDGIISSLLVAMTGFVGIFKEGRIYNEFGVFLVTSLICLFALESYKSEGKKKVLNSIILAILCAWQLTIHTRTFLFFAVFLFTIILMYICFNAKIVAIKWFVGILLPFYWLSQWVKDAVIDVLWRSGEFVYNGNNASVDMSKDISWIFTREGLKICKDVIISNVVTCTNLSYGLFLVAIFCLLSMCYMYIKHGKKRMVETATKSEISTYILLVLGVITVICMFAGLIYLNGRSSMLYFKGESEQTGVLRIYFFVRYYAPYIPLCFLAAYKLVDKIIPEFAYAIIIAFLFLSNIFMEHIYPNIKVNKFISDVLYFNPRETMVASYTLFFVLLLVILYVLLCKKSKSLYVVFIYSLLIYKLWPSSFNSNFSYVVADGGYQFVKKIEMQDLNIYAESNFQTYQFVLPNYIVKVGETKVLNKQEVFFTTHDLDKATYCTNFKYRIILDDNEIVYFNDDNIYEEALENGYQ